LVLLLNPRNQTVHCPKAFTECCLYAEDNTASRPFGTAAAAAAAVASAAISSDQ